MNPLRTISGELRRRVQAGDQWAAAVLIELIRNPIR